MYKNVTAPGWHGFVGIMEPFTEDKIINPSGNDNKWRLDASIYDKEGQSAQVLLSFQEEYLNTGRAKDLLASFKFEPHDAEESFQKGKTELSQNNWTDAMVHFLNALYLNEKNPEYAYHLARALYENKSGGKAVESRRSSAPRILEDALKIHPDHQPSKELLETILQETQIPAK